MGIYEGEKEILARSADYCDAPSWCFACFDTRLRRSTVYLYIILGVVITSLSFIKKYSKYPPAKPCLLIRSHEGNDADNVAPSTSCSSLNQPSHKADQPTFPVRLLSYQPPSFAKA